MNRHDLKSEVLRCSIAALCGSYSEMCKICEQESDQQTSEEPNITHMFHTRSCTTIRLLRDAVCCQSCRANDDRMVVLGLRRGGHTKEVSVIEEESYRLKQRG